jgi:hypothetical protein
MPVTRGNELACGLGGCPGCDAALDQLRSDIWAKTACGSRAGTLIQASPAGELNQVMLFHGVQILFIKSRNQRAIR